MSSAIVRSGCGSFMSAGALAVVLACGGAPAPPPSAPPAAAAPPAAHAVTAVVLVNGCAHFGVENARLAQTAINALVDGCSSFTGERVQFTATLLPGGAIQFEPGAHDSAAIPICVLNHPLTHRVQLQKACSLDVRLEQSSVVVPKSGDAGP
jgi:hypothetical protein